MRRTAPQTGEAMIRVIHSVSNMDRAGIETMLMNYYRRMDRDRVQFDFIVNKAKPGDYDDEILSMGGRIFRSPGLNPLHYPEYLRFVGDILKNNQDIRILHAHNEAMGLYALNGAKKAGLGVRIAHAHNTRIVRDYKWLLKIFCKQFLASSATDLWSCGRDAGIYFFGRKNWENRGMIMHNAIETDRFAWSPAVRSAMRKKYGLENKTVVGHVGRFNVQKNHARLLAVFSEYARVNENAVLLLIGEGELEEKMKNMAASLGISGKVIFAGLQSNVNEWYQAMDVFVMPSLFEGLPVVGVEAQASGLPCIFSSAVTDEILLSPFSCRVPLSDSDKEWADAISSALNRPCDRTSGAGYIRKAGYDIASEAARIQELYISMSDRK